MSIVDITLGLTNIYNNFHGKSVCLTDLLDERKIDYTDHRRDILISLFMWEYKYSEMMERLIPLIMQEEYSKEYLLLLLELAAENLHLFTGLLLDLNKFITDTALETPRRIMVNDTLKELREQLRARRLQEETEVKQTGSCSIL